MRIPTPGRGVGDWRALVYGVRGEGVGNGVRVLLLFLADHMDGQRRVSVPRSRIAGALGVSTAEVTKRIGAAHAAGLLDTVRKGRPHVTAQYQGLFPTPSRGNPVVTSNQTVRGMGNHTSSERSRGNPVVVASSKRSDSDAPSVSDAEALARPRQAAAPPRETEGSASGEGQRASGDRERGSDVVGRETVTRGAPNDGQRFDPWKNAKKKTNNAISERFARSADKRRLLDHVQRIAQLSLTAAASDDPDADDPVWDAEADLDAAAAEMFDLEHVFGWGFDDRGWKVPPAAVDRLIAGRWLNKYLNWYQLDQEPLTWRGDAEHEQTA